MEKSVSLLRLQNVVEVEIKGKWFPDKCPNITQAHLKIIRFPKWTFPKFGFKKSSIFKF